MSVPYYPHVDDPRHALLTENIKKICRENSALCMEMVQYYNLPKEDYNFLKNDFSHQGLWIRTLPDLYIHPKEPPAFFLDMKTTANPRYKNIAIELSCFYWTSRRNMADVRGSKCSHFYASWDLEGNIRIFSPLLVEVQRVIIPLFHWYKGQQVSWTEDEKQLFKHYATCVVKGPKKIQERNIKGGSGDPFVIIPQKQLGNHMQLDKFLEDHEARTDYVNRKGLITPMFQEFIHYQRT